jgi:hypothetical protein
VVPSLKAAAGGDWRFAIGALGYTPHVTARGIVFSAPSQQPINISDSFAYDSSKFGAQIEVSLRLTPGATKGSWILDTSLSQQWLRSPRRVWPVTVDPVISIGISSGTNYGTTGSSQPINLGSGSLDGSFTGAVGTNSSAIFRSIVYISLASMANKHINSAFFTLTEDTSGPMSTALTSQEAIYVPSAPTYDGAKNLPALASVSQANGLGDLGLQ